MVTFELKEGTKLNENAFIAARKMGTN
jgi:hypothetical protein